MVVYNNKIIIYIIYLNFFSNRRTSVVQVRLFYLKLLLTVQVPNSVTIAVFERSHTGEQERLNVYIIIMNSLLVYITHIEGGLLERTIFKNEVFESSNETWKLGWYQGCNTFEHTYFSVCVMRKRVAPGFSNLRKLSSFCSYIDSLYFTAEINDDEESWMIVKTPKMKSSQGNGLLAGSRLNFVYRNTPTLSPAGSKVWFHRTYVSCTPNSSA
ncbi:hypothetical protein AGLY_002805 [Aphis glycines]|uniref:Uncharacterized protein n=1 Tax=Aphis glycines TaxID=307491 RepID=A0A6G0U1E8_APHGL|nr:hypothetical protein AGLY_002805 [Aphis glycines]